MVGRAEKAKGASPSIDGKVDRAGKLKQVDEIEELAGNEGRFCEIRGRESYRYLLIGDWKGKSCRVISIL